MDHDMGLYSEDPALLLKPLSMYLNLKQNLQSLSSKSSAKVASKICLMHDFLNFTSMAYMYICNLALL